ncbi:hypothetical protein VTL71DRAFT_11258 [Oculimacula yallundae]|uniref:Membrane insertase YidC/Oxa/ALB C-terminal domain-containing protein n=1 Tax=Oculimacula yallundae TaxID=86028 RepID=A0ABR4CVS0_9HELO
MALLRQPSSLLRPSSSKLHSILLLPPLLRTRAFHATPRPQSILLSTITFSHEALTAVHSATGLPWAYSIPLFAILLRVTLILPVSIYTRRSNIKQIGLSPLLESWKHILRKQTMRESGHLGPVVAQSEVLKKMRKKRGELFRRHGCGTWKNYLSLLQIPIFLSVMEALRKMCGSRQGVLGMLLGKDEVGGAETSRGVVDYLLAIPLETSLATEGALWFPNLLLADPQLVLPFVLSGTILLNILGGRKSYSAMGKWQQRLTRSMTVVALAVGPLMLNVPSALMIYWITSSTTGYLQMLLLEKFMPLPKAIAPLQPKGQWKVALGQRPPGYVNPLLTMDKGALMKAAAVKKAISRSRPVLDDNKPIGRSSPRRGS